MVAVVYINVIMQWWK